MKNKMDNSTSEHIAAAGTDWDTKVKWSDGLHSVWSSLKATTK